MSCPACFTGFVHEGTPKGIIIQLGEIHCYYSGPGETTTERYPTLVIMTDVFGYSFKNIQLIADKYAESNIHVYIPD